MTSTSRERLELARRDFLRALTIAAGGLLAGSCDRPAEAPATNPGDAADVVTSERTRGAIIATGKFPDQHGSTHYTISTLDLDNPGPDAIRYLELPFFPHGVAADPRRPDHILIFEKKGKGCCRVDLSAMKMVETIETVANREFYGHGVYSTDGSVIYCTETDLEQDYAGVVAVRDAGDFRLMGKFPTFGSEPHDCRFTADGSMLVITNGGDAPGGARPPSVTYVDVKTEKLIDDLRFDTPRINAGHLALTPDGDLAVVSAPRKGMAFERDVTDLGGVTFRPAGGAFRTISEPADVIKQMLRESLSVAIHAPSGTVGVTNPDGNLVTFWNLDDGRYLSSLSLRRPHGIGLTLNDEEFLITHGGGRELAHVSPRTRKIVKTTRSKLPLLSGSHIVVHDLPTA